MGFTRYAQIRYNALDKCFSNFGRRYHINELVDACNQAIENFSGEQEGVHKRQVYEDIKFMESEAGFAIDLERTKEGKRVYFRYRDHNYSIKQSPLSQTELIQINETLAILVRFQGLPQFEWIGEISSRLESIGHTSAAQIIHFEQNQYLKGLEWINPLFQAIYHHKIVNISYQPFKETNRKEQLIRPALLKQYNQRWFLFGSNENGQLSNLALDRITAIQESTATFPEQRLPDFEEYFEDVIGVTIPANVEVLAIRLKIDPTLWPYIQTKPLHGSQKRVTTAGEDFIVELQLIPNYEFFSLILGFGDRIMVLSPETIVRQFKDRISAMVANYPA